MGLPCTRGVVMSHIALVEAVADEAVGTAHCDASPLNSEGLREPAERLGLSNSEATSACTLRDAMPGGIFEAGPAGGPVSPRKHLEPARN